MPFTKKNVSFRVYDFEAKLDASILPAFAERPLPPIETVKEEPLFGWVSPRHLLDTEMTEDTCLAGPFLHVNLATAQKKIPASLLRVYCRMEEIAIRKERDGQPLNKATRAEIRDGIRKRLLPKMPPTLTGSDLGLDFKDRRLYTDALSAKAVERLINLFHQTTHTALRPLSPEGAAFRLFNVSVEDLEPAVFTPKKNGDFVIRGAGLDFLTWLLYRVETGEATFDIGRGAPVEVALDGPVSLVLEAQGAHRVALRDGVPLDSVEMQAALLGGKKISSVRVFLKCGESAYDALVDGMNFVFRSVKLPPLDANRDERALFAECMEGMRAFTDIFYGVYGAFLRERADEAAWNEATEGFHRWLSGRHADA